MTWRRGAWIAGVAIVGLLAGACNGTTAASPSPSPTPSAAAASPPAEASPAPTPSPTEVLPANDVDDPVAALEAIVRYRDWLFENPDPEKLKLIYAERCECYEEVHSALTAMAADGRRMVVVRQRSYEAGVLLSSSGPSARVSYRIGTPEFHLVDESGDLLREVAAKPATAAEAFLVREGSRWVVVALVETEE